MNRVNDDRFKTLDASEGPDYRLVPDRSVLIDTIERVLMETKPQVAHRGDGSMLTIAPVVNYDLDLEQLLHVDEEGKCAHRLHFGRMRYGIQSLVGVVTRRKFEDMVRAQIHELLNTGHCKNQQGEWKIVAWSLFEKAYPRKTRSRREAKVEWDKFSMDDSGRGNDKPMETELVETKDMRFILEVVAAEMTGGDPVDPLYERTGRDNPGMKKFVATNNLRYAPPWWRKDRKECETLLREFDAFWGEMKERQVVEAFSPAELQMASLLLANGVRIGQVAETLGKPWQTLRAALEKKGLLPADGAEEPSAPPSGDAFDSLEASP